MYYIKPFDFNLSRHFHCCHGLITVFAALAPERATAVIMTEARRIEYGKYYKL